MGGGGKYEQQSESLGPASPGRSVMRDQSEKVAKTKAKDLPESATKISYGKRFAKTEEMYQARVMEKELEELAKEDGALDVPGRSRSAGGDAAAKKKTAKKSELERAEALQSRHQVLEQVTRGAPIGSVPPVQEAPPRSGLADVMGDAQRYWGMLRGGLKDASTAGVRLARLPMDLMMMAVSRLRPHHA